MKRINPFWRSTPARCDIGESAIPNLLCNARGRPATSPAGGMPRKMDHETKNRKYGQAESLKPRGRDTPARSCESAQFGECPERTVRHFSSIGRKGAGIEGKAGALAVG